MTAKPSVTENGTEMEAILSAQRESFNKDGFPSAKVRLDRLNRLIKVVSEVKDEFVRTVSEEYSNRCDLTTLMCDVMGSLMAIKASKKTVRKYMKEEHRTRHLTLIEIATGCKAKIVYQPMGVVAVVSPWNFPWTLMIQPLATILAAGNRAMIKPSSQVPKTSALLASQIRKHFDPTEVAVVLASGAGNDAFCSLPFDKMIFTGSPEVGKHVMGLASKNLVPVILELGGKNPVIIGEEANLVRAVDSILSAKVNFNNGQLCLTADTVYLPEEKLEDFVTNARAYMTNAFPSVLESNDYTATVNEKNFERLLGYIQEAREKDARLEPLTNPNEDFSKQKTRKIPPYLFINPTKDLKITQEEIFGPLLQVFPYQNLDDVIDKLKHSPRPLGLYYYGSDKKNIRKLELNTTSGGITINDIAMHGAAEEALPFGGIGNSGMGYYHGIWGFQAFSHCKAVYKQSRWNPTTKLFRAPFTKRNYAICEMLIKRLCK